MYKLWHLAPEYKYKSKDVIIVYWHVHTCNNILFLEVLGEYPGTCFAVCVNEAIPNIRN